MRQLKAFVSVVARAVLSVCDIISTAAALSMVHGTWPEAAIDCRACAQTRWKQAGA